MSTSTSTERLTVGRETLALRVTRADSGGSVLAFEVAMPAGGGPPHLHRHEAFELYRVDSGELAIYLEDERGVVERRVCRAGSVTSIPGGREHTIRNESQEEARAFVVLSPGAAMEGFVRTASRLASPDPAEVMRLAADHGVEITRPLEAPAQG